MMNLPFVNLKAQQTEVIKQQAETQLQTMSPDEIDAKIKSYGMTRAEAEAKAKEFGVDLSTYLNKLPPKGTPVSTTQSGPVVNISVPAAEPAVVQGDVMSLKNAKPTTQSTAVIPPLSAQDAEIFGLSFFRSQDNAFVSSPSIADKDYIIGTGDVIKISLWGQIQSLEEVTVDKEGRITLSSVGSMLVSGYSIDDAKKRVKSALARSYSGLETSPPTIFLDFSLSKLRPIRVFIMGEVHNPGGYFVNNFANVFNSLFVVGGPKPSGSLRDIRVIRNGKLIAKVDIYDYLLGATKTNDTRINDNDIIFIPLKGKTATVRGEVLRSYTYELKPDENLKQIMEFSGGIRNTVYLDRIQVDRILPFAKRSKGDLERRLFDVDFSEIAAGKKDYTIEDGDIITVFPISGRKENYVQIIGDVKRPGTYQIDQLRTVKDLIDAADGLAPTAYLKRAELMRQFKNEKMQIFTLDVEKILQKDPRHNIALEMRDSVRIYSIYDINPMASVTITGHVKSPRTLPFADSMTVGNMVRSLGGLEDSVYRANTFLDRADIVRINEDLVSQRTMQFNLANVLAGSEKDIPLLRGDILRVYALGEIKFLDKNVQIYGSVKRPGMYRLTDKLTITDLILQAGGFAENASTHQAEVARVMFTELKNDSLVRIVFSDLPNLFDTTRMAIEILHSTAGSFLLQDKDQIFIRPNPYFHLQEHVILSGEVVFPGVYTLEKPKERISDIIRRAGGLKKNAYARGGRLLRGNERFRTNIEEALGNTGGSYDATVQPGDNIDIQRNPNRVQVLGEVNNPGLYSFVSGKNLKFYLNFAGGLSDSANFVLVNYPEGFVEKAKRGWLWDDNPEIPDGSTIVITKIIPDPPEPPGPPGESFFSSWKDVMALLASTMTVIVLANQIK